MYSSQLHSVKWIFSQLDATYVVTSDLTLTVGFLCADACSAREREINRLHFVGS